MSTQTLHLCPRPRSLTIGAGTFHIAPDAYILLDAHTLYAPITIAAARHPLTAGLSVAVGQVSAGRTTAVTFAYDPAEVLGAEGYDLTIDESGVLIQYNAPAGAFYAMATLVQIIENTGADLPYLEIDDEPAFPTRGYMLDIGRNKVPKLAEMCALVDWLATMKINHVELYIEGIPFEYPSFPHMWKGRDILTGEDILALDEFCRARFVELVPTQNHFGHMDKWLLEEYRHLAECPDGFTFQGTFLPHPRCLNPLNPDSEGLVNRMADDLLPYFSSSQFNICCDETLELGQGHAKEACEAQGLGRVYLDFLQKVIANARAHGKSVLFWDDIIKSYPDLLPQIPQSAVALEWGYLANQPTADDCALMQSTGVRYFTCPGTGAWNTLLGKTNQMIANIRNAAEFGQQYGAEGLLNTDWGDSGHLQSLPTSYSGIAYGAAMAWDPTANRDMDLAAMLDTLVFKDAAHVMGRLVLDAGNYFEVENTKPVNITLSFILLISGLGATDGIPGGEDFDRMRAYLADLRARLATTDLHCDRADLILSEYRLAIDLIDLAQDVGDFHYGVKAHDTLKQTAMLERLVAKLPGLIEEIRRTWLIRNRYSYLDDSLAPLTGMLEEAKERVESLKY